MSESTTQSPTPRRRGSFHGGVLTTSRADLVLAAIPLLFAAALLASVALPVSLHGALLTAALPAAAAIVHGTFLDPPVSSS